MKSAGVTSTSRITPSGTRFGTLLNANGENAKVVQELRHASLKVATDVYMRAVSAQKREAQSKLVRGGALLN